MVKRCVIALVSLFLLVCLAIAALPSLLSSSFGTSLLSRYLAKALGGHIYAKTLSLSWFNEQNIEELVIDLPGKKCRFSCDKIHSNAGLFSLLSKNNVGTLEILHPELKFYQTLVKKPPLQEASLIGSFPLLLPSFKKIPHGEIVLTQGRLFIQGMEEIALTDLQAKCLSNDHLFLFLQANVSASDKKGSLEVKFDNAQDSPSLDVSLSALPLAALDSLAKKIELDFVPLTLLFGDELSLLAKAHLKEGEGDLVLQLESAKVLLSTNARLNPQCLMLEKPLVCTAKMDQELLFALSKFTSVSLPDSLAIDLTVDRAKIPLQGQKFDISQLAASASLNLFSHNATLHGQTLDELSLQAALSTENLNASFQSALLVQGLFQKSPFSLSAKGSLLQLLSSQRSGELLCELQELPTALVDPELASLLGQTLSSKLSVKKQATYQAELSVNSAFLSIPQLSLQGEETIALQSPASMTYRNPLLQTSCTCQLETLSLHLGDLTTSLQMAISELTLRGIPLGKGKCQIATASLNDIHLLFQADALSFEALFSYQNPKLTLKQPLTIQASAPLDLFAKRGFSWKPLTPLHATASISPFTYEMGKLEALKLDAKISLNPWSVQVAEQLPLTIENTGATVHFDFGKEAINASLHAALKEEGGALGNCEAALHVDRFSAPSGTCSFSLTGKDLPSSLLQILGAPNLSPLLSEKFSCTLEGKSEQAQDALFLSLGAKNLSFDAGFIAEDALLKVAKPCKLLLTLTPQGFNAIEAFLYPKRTPSYQLREKAQIHFALSSFKMPIERKAAPPFQRAIAFANDFSKTELISTLECPHLGFLETSKGLDVVLEALKVSVEKTTNPNLPISLGLTSDLLSFNQSQSAKEGKIAASFNSSNPFNEQGTLNLQDQRASFHLELESIPTSALDFFSELLGSPTPLFYDLFGPMLNAKAHFDLKNFSGPVMLSVLSQDSKAFLSGVLSQGVLTLKDPFIAEVKLSKRLSQKLCEEFTPLGIRYIETTHPLSFTIDPQGFSLPLFPAAMQNFNLFKARLDLGKVFCVTDGTLDFALGLLRFDTSSQKLPLWFTPIDLSAQNGILHVSRLDLLIADRLQLAFWGDVNLYEKNVNMVLGLTAQALSAAFGLTNLPEDYVIQIPVKGPFDHVEINTKKATAKITALLAIEQGGSLAEQFGGTKGAIIGGLLKNLSKLPDIDESAPPPQRPFPWEGPRKTSSEEEKQKKKKAIHSTDSPVKQVFKLLF